MQGGYNGWHNDVRAPDDAAGAARPRVSPGNIYKSISAGVAGPPAAGSPCQFHDLGSVEYVCQKYPVAAVITEPILQNIGIVARGRISRGLRSLADRFGFLLVLTK
jgi:glutamate-1-semialdehyde 2,1-aminomutase